MTITVEKLPDGPVVLATYQEPMDWRQEVPEMFRRILELRDTFEGCPKYYAVLDVSTVKLGFSEIVFALREAREASKQRREDMPIHLSLVGSGHLVQLVSKALEQKQYGEYHMPLYTSLDKALEIVRADIATWSK